MPPKALSKCWFKSFQTSSYLHSSLFDHRYKNTHSFLFAYGILWNALHALDGKDKKRTRKMDPPRPNDGAGSTLPFGREPFPRKKRERERDIDRPDLRVQIRETMRYAMTQSETEALAGFLQNNGLKVAAYHGSLSLGEREEA